MLKPTLIGRLLVAGAMAILLLTGLAYWWLDNLPHELFGTAMFALLARHIFVNRLWVKNLSRGRYDVRRGIVTALHLLLMINMAVLLVTSIAISKSIFSPLHIPASVSLRELHWFSAYWIMIAVGVHLGLHWSRVMAIVRTSLELSQKSAARTLLLRAAAALFGLLGAWSIFVLDVWTKLTFNYSLEFWDFNDSVTPFFVHWAGVVALPAIIAHYAITWSRGRGRTNLAGARQRAIAGPAS